MCVSVCVCVCGEKGLKDVSERKADTNSLLFSAGEFCVRKGASYGDRQSLKWRQSTRCYSGPMCCTTMVWIPSNLSAELPADPLTRQLILPRVMDPVETCHICFLKLCFCFFQGGETRDKCLTEKLIASTQPCKVKVALVFCGPLLSSEMKIKKHCLKLTQRCFIVHLFSRDFTHK